MKKGLYGFTLVEMVMVMVIIGLLAAIIVPRFTSQKDQASIAATRANLENLRTAVALYYAQEGQYPDPIGDLVSGGVQTGEVYIRAIPPDGFLGDSTVELGAGSGCGTAGGWCYDDINGDVFVDLPDDDPLYGNVNWSVE